MSRTLWIAASGMEAQQMKTDNIANNIANVNTQGYKKGMIRFKDMLYQKVSSPGAGTANGAIPAGIQLGTGVQVASASKLFTQGSLESSSADLDVAIEGNGFFQVSLPSGKTAYTRAGSFHMDQAGQVVTGEGFPVLGFPTLDTNSTSISISQDGTVSSFSGGTTSEKGRITLARFANPEGLSYLGGNLYEESAVSGSAQTGNPSTSDFGNIAQHKLEGSNVDIVKEMVDMIAAQRAYELNSKSIKTADDMLRMVAGLK